MIWFLQMWKQYISSEQIILKANCQTLVTDECCCYCSHTGTAHFSCLDWDQHMTLNVTDSVNTCFCHTAIPYNRKKKNISLWKVMYHNFKFHFLFTLQVAHDLTMTVSYMHLPAAWWAFMVVVVPCQRSWLHTVIFNIQSKQRWCILHLHSEAEQIYMPTVFSVWYEISTIIIFHSLHISPTLYILSSSLTVSFSLQQHLCDSHWAGYPLLAGRGVESLSITRSHGWSASDVNQPVSCCDGCLSHRSIPSLLTWYDGRWYSTTAHWAQMLAGASSIRRPWQTTLYSFNPRVLKQHLTQIEVGFVIAEEEKKMTDGKYEKEG